MNENILNHGQNLKTIILKDQESHECGNVPLKKKHANYANSASFIKSPNIILVLPNCAKNYASTIDEGLLKRWWGKHVLIYVMRICWSSAQPPGPPCKQPLGMESKKIPDDRISASSEWNANHGPSNARLNFQPAGGKTGAWSAKTNDVNQWLQVDFGDTKKVTAILTQGRQELDQWVKTYTVSYSQDGSTFIDYKQNGQKKVSQSHPSPPCFALLSSPIPQHPRPSLPRLARLFFSVPPSERLERAIPCLGEVCVLYC